jgi:hypothetical protein
MRTPKGLSAPRPKAFTPENVARFFLYTYEAKFNEKANHQSLSTANVDETGITTV